MCFKLTLTIKTYYQFLPESIHFEHVSPSVKLSPTPRLTRLSNTNFPLAAPANLKLRTALVADSGRNIRLAIPVTQWRQNCTENFLEVRLSF